MKERTAAIDDATGRSDEVAPSGEADARNEPDLDPADWVDNHGDYLFNYAIGQVRSQHSAEELVQETLVAAISARDSFKGDSTVRTWLTSILRHKIADHIRKRSRERKRFDEGATEEALREMFNDHGFWKASVSKSAGLPRTPSDRAEFWRAFHECTQKLSPSLADAFCLREVNGMGTTEICDLLEVSQTNLSTMLYRARLLLRKCLESNWFDRDPDRRTTENDPEKSERHP